MTLRSDSREGPDERLPRLRRVQRRADFQAVYSMRASVADDALVVYARANGRPSSRLGLSVGVKHGGSVRRNRIKRLLREAFRRSRGAVPAGYDFVFVPRDFSTVTLQRLMKMVPRLATEAARRADRKKTPPAAGGERG